MLRPSRVLLAVLVLLVAFPTASRADRNVPILVEAQVLAGSTIPAQRDAGYSLMVQATSWAGSGYYYILVLSNLTPWPMRAIRVLDRYLPPDLNDPEVHHLWTPDVLHPGQTTAFMVHLPTGPVAGACHQLEIRLAEGLDTILMDCNPAGATIIWQVPIDDGWEDLFVPQTLTLPEPTGRSKLGIHLTRNNSADVMAFVRQARPSVIVAVGDLGWLTKAKEASPETITIGRFLEEDQTFTGDPAQRAREFVQAHLERYRLNPGVDYWLGWNEPVISEHWQMAWYAAFEAERTAAMAELGFKVAIGNFAVGTPEADEFEAFLPAIAAIKQYGGLLALHEYSAPTLYEGVGAGVPGIEPNAEHGALTLRYRCWYDTFLRERDLVVPLVITELGIDGGVLQEGGKPQGWRDFHGELSYLAPQEASGEYLAQLSWYDDELRRDPYVVGFAIFNVGDQDGRWRSFDVTAILPQLTELVIRKDMTLE